ncbi:NHS-like protein 2 isoform X1 [Poecilia formosa]|uniref:NHS-like protein 2 isoform X1 n=1 Tax=Poecilia formosa TaxID=48698 RepID=UPI0007BA862F|nr:PREDICTED: NHS-like protein 2 isoform X1 [Poecilia formosa]
MPFCKRTILPKDVCKPDGGGGKLRAEVFGELAGVCGSSLCSVLRQLSDLSRHSVSILEELEGELVSVCRRSGALEGRLVRLQRHVAELLSKPPPRAASGLEAESGRRGGSNSVSSHGDGNHSSGGGGGSISSGGGGSAAHFRSPWQQSVNVFGSWSRPECVEELHQQAQLNLQSLLQEFEEQLYDTKLTGQTFRHPSSQSSDDTSTSLSRSPVSLNSKRPDFIFLPASKQLYEDETTSSVFGLRSVVNPSPSPTPSPCGSDRPPLGWSSNNSSSSTATSATTGPPVAEKPRWHPLRRTPAHCMPLDVTGEVGAVKFHGVDLLQHSPSPSPSPGDSYPQQPHSLELFTDTPHQNLPIRKTHSELDTTLPTDNRLGQRPPELLHTAAMDHSGLLCSNTPSSTWNGPKGSTFSPAAWSETYNYNMSKGPAVPPKHHSVIGHAGGIQDGVMLVSSGQSVSSHSSSFTCVTDPTGRTGNGGSGISPPVVTVGKRRETEGAPADGGRGGGAEAGRGRQRSARSIAAQNAFKFRERSLSTPTDSGSFCFTEGGIEPDLTITTTGNGNTMVMDHHQEHHNYLGHGENYALLYPRGSSEDSASTTDTISVTASDYSTEGRLRLRSRSISLKKSKRKPPPPVRSVSLMKNLGEAEGRLRHGGGLYRDGRPKSLHIPRDNFPEFQPDFLLTSSSCSSKASVGERELGQGGNDGPPSLEVQAPEREGETQMTFPTHWQLGEWKSNDPYRSLSGSSTATGTTVIECMKVRSSSESLLDSPSTSRATSPSQLSMETDLKASSPLKPPGLISPSSGYSSQSETPTPTVPMNHGTVGTTGCKMRPKIPERKSSLPSPKDPSARSRLSFEMPGNAHLELSSLKPKQKASRRHSDTSTAAKPGKISPSSSQALPMVTQNELKTIRLRSVSRGDLEDCPDGASDTIEEEQHGRDISDNPSPPPTLPKPKPPVAVKPPLPKRPMNLLLKSPSPSSTSPLAIESPPASPVERPVPLGNIYKVMKKPKPKKPPPQTPTSPAAPPDLNSASVPPTAYDHPFLPHSKSLFDLPPLPDPQPLLEDPMLEPEFDREPHIRLAPEDGGSLPSPCSSQEGPELQDKSKTLPSRMTISCLAELSDKKKPKVPPPVPKKPNVLLLPTPLHPSTNGSTDRQIPQSDSPVGLRSPVGAFAPDDMPASSTGLDMSEQDENHLGPDEDSSKESSLQSSLQDSSLTEIGEKMASTGIGADDLAADEKTALHIAEETEDDLLTSTPTTHTTEDLFTIIHRSKRKVLGRKEPSDSFGSRQSLVSPVKHSAIVSDHRNLTLGSSQRSSSRNENFMALLQKKGSKSSSGGARVSAMELLKSTNPLARRVTEFSNANASAGEGGEVPSASDKLNDQ